MALSVAKKEEGLSPFAFHQGQTLMRVADHYPFLVDVIIEAIQNALDANATIIWVVLDHQKHKLRIEDNGEGASKNKFEKALQSVCESIKEETDLGRFGMGLISPLGKCEYFTYTSTPKESDNAFLKWTFRTETIKQQKIIPGIPLEKMSEIHFDKNGKAKNGVPWRSQIKLMRFTEDRTISKLSIELLHDSVKEKYSEKMKKLKTRIIAKFISAEGKTEEKEILADDYQGKSLPSITLNHPDSGQTIFRLFLARQTPKGRKGKVVIGETSNDFRLSFKKFLKTPEGFLNKGIFEALCSGIFEGEILTEKAKIDSTRKFFKENDALVGFCITIEDWYRQIGQTHFNAVQEERQNDRYQELGLRSMRVIESILNHPEFKILKDVLQSFKVGSIGPGHAQPKKIIGTQEFPSTSIHGDGDKEKRNGDDGSNGQAKKEHPGHTPLTVGNKGKQRKLVKNNSLGLHFNYIEDDNLSKIWELDNRTGTLNFNTLNELFGLCDKGNDKHLMRFQEHIAINALLMETAPEEWKKRHRELFDESLPMYVYLLIHADEIAAQKPKTKDKK